METPIDTWNEARPDEELSRFVSKHLAQLATVDLGL